MKPIVYLLCMMMLCAVVAKAQTKTSEPARQKTTTPAKQPPQRNKFNYDQSLKKANNSVNGVNNSVNNTSAAGTNAVNTAANAKTQVKTLADQVNALVGKSKAAEGTANTTQITIKGANFAKLKQLTEAIQRCPGVQDAKMKFGSGESMITVTHTGTTTKLLEAIQKKSDLVTDNSIDNVDEGAIAIHL
ncbi:MAG TPA: hypothetical protein VHC47_01935 [Mucilaginibacter sp.]|nr:hypothetical protein [Mucilaginibacter sp.]